MTKLDPTGAVDRRRRGLALADALLVKSRVLAPLPRAAHQRVQRRLRASLSPRAGRRQTWLRPVVVAVALLSSGTAFGIALNRLMTEPPPAPAPDAPVAAGDARASVRARARKNRDAKRAELQTALPDPQAIAPIAEPAAEPTVSAPVAAPPLEEARALPAPPAKAVLRLALRSSSGPRAVSVAATAAAADEAAATWEPAPDPPAPTEEALLATAVRALRVGQDPLPALAALDDYRARHRDGRLSIEATVLRAEALTALGRNAEALDGLDTIDLGRVPGAVERRFERGKLRESTGASAKALADFDWVLAHAQQPALIEAALAERMRCRQRLGDLAGARGDALEYLRRFRGGPSASLATELATAGAKTESP